MNDLQQRLDWHSMSVDEVVRYFSSDAKRGIAHKEALKRLATFGLNAIHVTKERSLFVVFLMQFKSPLLLVLIMAGVVSALFHEYGDAIIVGITVVVNGIIGTVQEYRASKAFLRLQERITKKSIVLREGSEHLVDTDMIVPGDVVVLRAGDYVPADARITSVQRFRVNESVLTGEWIEVDKSVEELDPNVPLAERTNMAWAGTLVEEGAAEAVVVGTGNFTEFGKISVLVGETEKNKTPLQRGIASIARFIGTFVVFTVVVIFIAGVLRGQDPEAMFLTSVAIAVAAVPEGLPVAVTVILALGMERILRRGGLVRHLMAAETLGSTTVILTDKTGTLTEARMEVSQVVVGAQAILPNDTEEPKNEDGASLILRAGMYTTDAFVENPEDEFDAWTVRGSPTARALLFAGARSGFKRETLLRAEPRVDFFPFNPERRFAASLHKVEGGEKLYVVGAPETVLASSNRLWTPNDTVSLGDADRSVLTGTYDNATAEGLHVLGVAYKEADHIGDMRNETGDALLNLVFVGFVAFHDPLRPDVKESIALAKDAGLRPVIVTGDNKMTALKIAREVGIDASEETVMEGSELEKLSEKELMRVLPTMQVFARVLPHQKLILVEAWQKQGAVVAMTGDGVNDAPAIKRADVGVALESGTDVAKEAADVVLLHDSFTILVAAIEEGRVILDNLRKVITYLFSTGFTEIILVGGSLLFGYPLPLLPGHILWTNLVGEGLINFSFAFEPKEDDVMHQGIHKKDSGIFTKEMWRLVFIVGIATDALLLGLYFFLTYAGHPIEYIRTIMFAGLGVSSLFFTFSMRSLRRPLWKIPIFSNKFFIGAFLLSAGLFSIAFIVPGLREILRIMPLDGEGVVLVVGLATINLCAIEFGKWMFGYRNGNGAGSRIRKT